MKTVLSLPAITVSGHEALVRTIDRPLEGADIIDMVHLASGRKADAFVTFDKDIARILKAAAPVPETLA